MSSLTITHLPKRGNSPRFTAVVTDAADLPEVLDDARVTGTVNEQKLRERRWSLEHGDPEQGRHWYGLTGYRTSIITDAAAILRNGWVEGVEMMKSLAASTTVDFPPPVSIRRRQCWTENGDELDNDRYYSGRFDQMWRGGARRTTFTQQVISIVVPWGAISIYSAEQLRYNGLAVMWLADILDQAGYETEIAGASGVTTGSGPTTFRHVTVKRAGEPLALDVVAGTLSHPAVFRCFGISMNLQADRKMVAVGSTDSPLMYLDRLTEEGILPPADVIMKNSYSAEEAEQAVLAALEQLAGAGTITVL